MTTQPLIDGTKLDEVVERFVPYLGAVTRTRTGLIGNEPGPYKALADMEQSPARRGRWL